MAASIRPLSKRVAPPGGRHPEGDSRLAGAAGPPVVAETDHGGRSERRSGNVHGHPAPGVHPDAVQVGQAVRDDRCRRRWCSSSAAREAEGDVLRRRGRDPDPRGPRARGHRPPRGSPRELAARDRDAHLDAGSRASAGHTRSGRRSVRPRIGSSGPIALSQSASRAPTRPGPLRPGIESGIRGGPPAKADASGTGRTGHRGASTGIGERIARAL